MMLKRVWKAVRKLFNAKICASVTSSLAPFNRMKAMRNSFWEFAAFGTRGPSAAMTSSMVTVRRVAVMVSFSRAMRARSMEAFSSK